MKKKTKKNSGRLKKREKVFPQIADHSHPWPPTCLHSVSVYLEVPVHNLGWMQVVKSRDDLGAIEARALLWEHPLSGQMEKQLREKEGGREREGEREREGGGEREGKDSRDGTAIITDLLEEISTTQTGCPHHIEMIDSGGEGEQGVCVWGVHVERGWVGGVSEEGGWRRSAAGASSSSPPPYHSLTHTHTFAYLFHVTLWARLALCWRGVRRRGPNQGFNQYTSLVKDRPTAAAAAVAISANVPPPFHPNSL